MNKKNIPVAAALIINQNKILISQRKKEQDFAGYWEFPGGKVEPGEKPEDCVLREVQEELGIQISVEKLFSEITHDYRDKQVQLQFFICKHISGEIQCLEVADYRWKKIDQLDPEDFPAANREVILNLIQSLYN